MHAGNKLIMVILIYIAGGVIYSDGCSIFQHFFLLQERVKERLQRSKESRSSSQILQVTRFISLIYKSFISQFLMRLYEILESQ